MMQRDFLFVGCEAGHDWQSTGGCSAGCSQWCSCSVPVCVCSRCGVCDYGENVNAFPDLKDGDFFSKRAAFRPGE